MIQPGDRVRLRHGVSTDPAMVAAAVDGAGQVTCYWFGPSGLTNQTFPMQALYVADLFEMIVQNVPIWYERLADGSQIEITPQNLAPLPTIPPQPWGPSAEEMHAAWLAANAGTLTPFPDPFAEPHQPLLHPKK